MVIYDPKKQKKLRNDREDHLLKAIEKAKKDRKIIDEGKLLMELGEFHIEMEDYKKATLIMEEASSKFIIANDQNLLSQTMDARKKLKEIQKETKNTVARMGSLPLPEYPKMLDQFIKEIIGNLDLSAFLNNVIQSIIKLTEADRGFLILIDEQGKTHSKIIVTKDAPTQKGSFPVRNFSQNVIKEVLRTRKPIFLNNVLSDQRFKDADSITSIDIRSIICVPLKKDKTTTGLIGIDKKSCVNAFSPDHFALIQSLAEYASLALINAGFHFTAQESSEAESPEDQKNRTTFYRKM